MKNYDLYGFANDDMEAARADIERALGVNFVAHESSFRCGEYYRFGNTGSEHFILQENFDQREGEWVEEEFPDKNVILYVNETNRADEIRNLLIDDNIGAAFLRRQKV